ncbi:MAG: hypothetical protein K2G83_06205 [Ruminococcus sp.]|nr:hypothetical protein [Ruminococcus sp.]
MGKIYFTRKLTEHNLFSESGEYDENWVSISLNRSRYIMPETKFLYGCAIGRKVDFWEYRTMDYINYNLMYDRSIIFVGSKRLYKKALKKYASHSIYDRKLRSYENRFVVHSTTAENYERISRQGCIKSWNILKKEISDFETKPIGTMLGDPEDFRDYIMLGSGVQCEVVVLSRQKNRLCYDADEEYTPGARIYFDNKILAEKGLLVRDGLHYKVKNELPLELALFTATADNIKINGKITPNTFTEAADIKFSEYINIK